jgi:hypothetical protein
MRNGVGESIAPAEPEADVDLTSASTGLHVPLQARHGDPLPGLSEDEIARFEAGKEEFEEDETAEDGLGPVFNDTSCARCHTDPAVGGSSALVETGSERWGRMEGSPGCPSTAAL